MRFGDMGRFLVSPLVLDRSIVPGLFQPPLILQFYLTFDLVRVIHIVHTCTADNGEEFARHEKISKELGAQVYFATPYRSFELGLNEHTNGLVREYFPKGTDFRKVSAKQIHVVEDRINNRPRKVLGYRIPAEVFVEAHGESV
ncbi:MAG: IS30 family transposase [Gammaproteobacteria bacterium]|nr:IS30 family transposase [Gammaproteobacteria bacterium]MCY4357618.1 IS30 family transposase [Gammaproteobacteria bacterium]